VGSLELHWLLCGIDVEWHRLSEIETTWFIDLKIFQICCVFEHVEFKRCHTLPFM